MIASGPIRKCFDTFVILPNLLFHEFHAVPRPTREDHRGFILTVTLSTVERP
jgi:hypothetical protein